MNKKQKLIVGVLILAVIASAMLVVAFRYQNNQFTEINPLPRCSQKDREQNNCVPAGRCTPPGDPQEAVIDCDIKDYDHKFNLEE